MPIIARNLSIFREKCINKNEKTVNDKLNINGNPELIILDERINGLDPSVLHGKEKFVCVLIFTILYIVIFWLIGFFVNRTVDY